MRLYDRLILPRLVNAACGVAAVARERGRIVPEASGRVLEVGFGSGLNLPFYDPREVRHVWALEPSREIWELARGRVESAPFPVEWVEARAEEIPLEDHGVDTVLVTFALCTIPDAPRAVEELGRVLRPGGRLLFCEHGAAPDDRVLRWQDRLDPLWGRLAGGCHLNRRPTDLLRGGGFQVTELWTGYIPGWKVDSFIYRGTAVPARAA